MLVRGAKKEIQALIYIIRAKTPCSSAFPYGIAHKEQQAVESVFPRPLFVMFIILKCGLVSEFAIKLANAACAKSKLLYTLSLSLSRTVSLSLSTQIGCTD